VAALLLGYVAGLLNLTQTTPDGELALLLSGVAARLASILFLSMFVVGAVVRARRVGSSDGVLPRVFALAGTFLPMLAFLLPRAPEAVSMLTRSFPAYAAYAARTPRFIPRLF
jgi:hypothetical protein